MRNFEKNEIMNFLSKEIEEKIVGNKFIFKLISTENDKPKNENGIHIFKATVIGYNMANVFNSDMLPFDLKIIIENENIEKYLNIINIESIKYVC